MNNFDKYFSLYEPTDPPPIITQGYKQVRDTYNQFLSSAHATPIKELDLESNPFKIQTEPINFKFTYQNQRSNPEVQGVVNLARQFVGSKYQWGGSTPNTGFDCSGLIQYVYKQNGIQLPRTTKELEKVGSEVPNLEDVKVGDLICTTGSGSNGKHIKLVSKIEDGQIFTIEAKGKKDGIIESPLINTSNITTIRRVLNQSNNNYIIDYFVNKGLTLNQARGIYGNLMQESGGNIKAISSDGNNSYGLAQWTGPRKEKLFSMYGQNPTAEQQLDFLWWELNNTHKDALDALKNTNTTYDATKVFMDKFEKPHKNYANFNKRLKYANA